MPLIAYALASYIGGLYAGFADSLILAAIATIAAGAIGVTRARAVAIGYAGLALAGFAIARTAERDDQGCASAALGAQTLTLIVTDSVGPGGFTRARIAECQAMVALSVAQGGAEAGSTIVAQGVVLRAQRGLSMQRAVVVTQRAPSRLARMRASTGRAIDRSFGSDAPLVRALLIADTHELSPEMRERFAVAGLTHILAISGSHIAIIALALAIAFELAGVSRMHSAVATVAVTVSYVALIGAPVAAVRSVLMLVLHVVTRVAQHPTSRWAIVALGASHAVISPRVVLDVGYQLSVIGAASIISAALLVRRLPMQRLPALARVVAIGLLGTTIASVGSAPIVAWVFGRVSLIGPLANLAAAPIIAVAQPMIFLGMVFLPIPPLARFVADAAHPLLVAFDRVALYSAAVPHASVAVAPSITVAVLAGVMSGAVIVACASRDWQRPAMVAATAAAAMVWVPPPPLTNGQVELHMIDVGQGDAVALRTPGGRWILVDAGGAWRGGDAGRSTVVPYIGRRGGPVDLFILSHPHTDHVGGASAALRALHPRAYVDAGFPGPADAYRASLETARAEHVRWMRAHPGDDLSMDGVTLRILAPDSTWTASLDDPNLASVIVLVQYGDVRMLLMGDAERPEEEWLLAHAASDLRADILKVGHHGSKTSSSERFLDAVRPRLALVSVGAGNSYHLPTPAILERLAVYGAQVLRTDRVGTIVARTDGQRIWIDAAGDEWELSRTSNTP